jgi:hypothetical protein
MFVVSGEDYQTVTIHRSMVIPPTLEMKKKVIKDMEDGLIAFIKERTDIDIPNKDEIHVKVLASDERKFNFISPANCQMLKSDGPLALKDFATWLSLQAKHYGIAEKTEEASDKPAEAPKQEEPKQAPKQETPRKPLPPRKEEPKQEPKKPLPPRKEEPKQEPKKPLPPRKAKVQPLSDDIGLWTNEQIAAYINGVDYEV